MMLHPVKIYCPCEQPNLGAQRGIVLLTVLVMLAVASAWATYAWRQVFWQQRMLHSQGLEQMAWNVAEAGGLHIHDRMAKLIKLNPGLNIVAGLPAINIPHRLEGSPSGHWQISAVQPLTRTPPNTEGMRISISGHVNNSHNSGAHIAQAHLLIDLETTGSGIRITRWQRVYPR